MAAMKIIELLEGRQPRYVARRDFDLMPNTEYRGYVLGGEDMGDEDTRKSTYAVYRPIGKNNHGQDEYIRMHTVRDPKTNRDHSPYERGVNIPAMYRYTVDQLESGGLQPERIAVWPAQGPEGDDIEPQAKPAQLAESDDNFTSDDLRELSKIKDVQAARDKAIELISSTTRRRMDPRKVAWFKTHVNTIKSVDGIVRMMYDMLLSGEGNKVIGTRGGMSDNSYRRTFREGDFIMFEDGTSATAGVIVELGEDTIVIEGGVYPLDESDLDPYGRGKACVEETYKFRRDMKKDFSTIVNDVIDMDTTPRDFFTRSKYARQHVYGAILPHAPHITPADADEGADEIKARLSKLGYDPEEVQVVKTADGTGIVVRIVLTIDPKGDRIAEAEYHGRTVKLGKPMAGDVKKYKVYVKDPKTGNVKKVNFGDKGMEIKRDDPKRRKNFRARHGCGTPRSSDRTKAAYWSCRLWSTKPVSKILKGK